MSEPGRDREDRDEVDRRFREIVAGLEREPPDAGPGARERGPGPEAAPGRSAPEAPDAPPASPPGRPSHLGPGTPEGMATDHRSYEPPEEDDHFVPPRPDPLPAGDLHFWAILVGLVAGPLLIFLSAVLPVLSTFWTAVGTVLTLVGFVLLVLRQPRYRRHDGDWGARV